MSSDAKFDIFLSHAGQEKRDFVDLVYHLLIYRGGVLCEQRAFMDEPSLKPGDPKRPWSVIINAAKHCSAAVVVLSPSFVRKEDPMAELELLLQRCTNEPKDFILLPVFLGLTVEDCLDLDAWYHAHPWPADLPAVTDSILKKWAALVKSVPLEATGSRLDQTSGFQGMLATRVVDEVIERLVEVGKLPKSLSRKCHTALEPDRMLLRLPSQHLFGREDEINQVMTGLCGKAGAVIVVGPPGEGKTTVAVHAAMALCEQGWFPGGAFQVDLSGFTKGSHVGDFLARRVTEALEAAKGLTTRPAKPYWKEVAEWLSQADATDMVAKWVLLVLENTEDLLYIPDAAQELRRLLEDEVQRFGMGKQRSVRLVVNTRRNPEMRLDGARRIVLDRLAAPDALLLLEQHVGDWHWQRIQEAGRMQLVETCQRNPLLLIITGSFISQDLCTAEDVCRLYSSLRQITSVDSSDTQFANDLLKSHRVHLGWLLSMLSEAEQQAVVRLSLFPGSFDAAGAAAVVSGVGLPDSLSDSSQNLPSSDTQAGMQHLLKRLQRLSVLQLHSGVQQTPAAPTAAAAAAKAPRYQMHLLVKELAADLRWHLKKPAFVRHVLWCCFCLLLTAATAAASYTAPASILPIALASAVSNTAAAASVNAASAVLSTAAATMMAMSLALPAVKSAWHSYWHDEDTQLAQRRLVGWMLLAAYGPGQRMVQQCKRGTLDACRRIMADEACNFAEAARLVDDVVEGMDKAAGPTAKKVMQRAVNQVFGALASALRRMPNGSIVRADEARQVQQEAVQYLGALLGAMHPVTLGAKQHLAWMLHMSGELNLCTKACDIYRELEKAFTKVRGPKHRDTMLCCGGLAEVLLGLGKLEEGEQLLCKVMRHFAEGDDHDGVHWVNHYDATLWQLAQDRCATVTSVDNELLEAVSLAQQALRQDDDAVVAFSTLEMEDEEEAQTDTSATRAAQAASGAQAQADDEAATAMEAQVRIKDPRVAETLAGWAMEFLDDKLEDSLQPLRSLRQKLGLQYTDGMLTHPMMVTDEERQAAFDAVRRLEPFWRKVADKVSTGDMTAADLSSCMHWVERAREYRELAEPVTIAQWYFQNRHLLGAVQGGGGLVGQHYAEHLITAEDECSVDNGVRPVQFMLLQGLERDAFDQPIVCTVHVAHKFASLLGYTSWAGGAGGKVDGVKGAPDGLSKLELALEIARGMFYLHDERSPVQYLDLKP